MGGETWTPEQVNFLANNWNGKTAAEVAAEMTIKFPYRRWTEDGVRRKANRMKPKIMFRPSRPGRKRESTSTLYWKSPEYHDQIELNRLISNLGNGRMVTAYSGAALMTGRAGDRGEEETRIRGEV